MLSQCFEPEPLLLMGLEALGNFHTKAQSPSLLGFGDIILEGSLLGRPFLFLSKMVSDSFSP